MAKRYAMVYDSNKCIGCQSCGVQCRSENSVPDGVSRLQVWIIGPKGKFPNLTMDFHRQSCVMCEDAPCVRVCPTGASYKNADGIIMVDNDKCVGCKYCITACPYQARFINTQTGAADKCTFCFENRVSKGQKPACVATCPTSALTFGDLNDPQNEIKGVIIKQRVEKAKAHLGTNPNVMTIPNWHGGE